MAEFIKSVWKITRDAVVLLDFDDRLIDEPNFSFEKEIQVSLGMRAAAVKIFDRGNVKHSPTWQRIVRKDSVNEARAWRLDHMIEVEALIKGPMTIELKDGPSWTLSDAVVQAAESASGLAVSKKSFDAMMSYSVIGNTLEKVI